MGPLEALILNTLEQRSSSFLSLNCQCKGWTGGGGWWCRNQKEYEDTQMEMILV